MNRNLDNRDWQVLNIPKGRREEVYTVYIDNTDKRLLPMITNAEPKFHHHRSTYGKDEVRRIIKEKQSDGSFKRVTQSLERFMVGLMCGDSRQARSLRNVFFLRDKPVPRNYFSYDLVAIISRRPKNKVRPLQESVRSMIPFFGPGAEPKQKVNPIVEIADIQKNFARIMIKAINGISGLSIVDREGMLSELDSQRSKLHDLIRGEKI